MVIYIRQDILFFKQRSREEEEVTNLPTKFVTIQDGVAIEDIAREFDNTNRIDDITLFLSISI